jgi:hypothetical protein
MSDRAEMGHFERSRAAGSSSCQPPLPELLSGIPSVQHLQQAAD